MDSTTADNPPESGRRRIIERPDGIYWEDMSTNEIAGPFESIAEARADMEYRSDSAFEPGETLQDAESELGIADWLDQDTGQPAEESVPRIEEDH